MNNFFRAKPCFTKCTIFLNSKPNHAVSHRLNLPFSPQGYSRTAATSTTRFYSLAHKTSSLLYQSVNLVTAAQIHSSRSAQNVYFAPRKGLMPDSNKEQKHSPNLNQKVDAILYDRNKHMIQEKKHEPMIVDPHISTNMSATYLEVYTKLIDALPTIEENFFRSPLTDKKKKNSNETSSTTSNRAGSVLYNLQATLANITRPIDLFVHQKLLNNPEIIPEDNNIVFLRMDTVHREINLAGKPPQISESETEPLFKPEAFNELRYQKSTYQSYSGCGIAQAQQTQATASNTPEGTQDSIQKSESRKSIGFDKTKLYKLQRNRCKETYSGEFIYFLQKEKEFDSTTRDKDRDQLWFAIGNLFASVQKEASSRSKQGTDGKNLCSISKESNIGGLEKTKKAGVSDKIKEIATIPAQTITHLEMVINLKKIALKVSTAKIRDLRREALKLIKAKIYPYVDAILYDRNKHMIQEKKHEPMIVDPHISTNMSATYLEVYTKLIDALPTIEENFFRSPLTDKKKKNSNETSSTTSNRAGSVLYNLQATLANITRPIDLFVHQKLLNNPEIIPEDNNIVFLRMDTVHREINLAGKPPQISESETEPLFKPEAFNELSYSGCGIAQVQKAQATASTAPSNNPAPNNHSAANNQQIEKGSKILFRNLNSEKPKASTKQNFINPREIGAKQPILENLWFAIENIFASVQKEASPRSKQITGRKILCSISKESNRGGKNKDSWLLQSTVFNTKENRRAQISL
ncbi:hypothetical protein BB561_005683 [Smittium simulii]|uniref:Uncharacterized protein n=1 Tax=Smittium simulii TaxID=133385 RepID=A0A2T9Y927_9FUNG|nr:hypothetical protein BB561_005683 [Smittium simulii]